MSKEIKRKAGCLLIIFVALLFLLTSCQNEISTVVSYEGENINILELDEAAVVNAMIFDRYALSLIYNTNEEVPINRTIDIYAMFITKNSTDTVNSALTNRFSEIALYSDEKKIITSDKYTVDSIAVEDGVLFTLKLSVNDISYIDETFCIEKIVFAYSPDAAVQKEVGIFNLTFYREEKNKINIIESPAANAAEISKGEFLFVNYLFLCTNSNAKDSFNVTFNLPPNMEKVADVSLADIHKDEEMAETALSVLYANLTPEQRNALNVYSMSVSLTKNTDSGFIIQLLFDTDILGKQQSMGAFCPLIIH